MSIRKDKQYLELCFSAAKIFSTCGKKKYAGGCPRFKEMSLSGSNYDNCIAVHAEANALLHSDYSSKPTKLYVNGPPCFSCAKLVANSTIEEVYYVKDESYFEWKNIEAFLNKAGENTIEMGI